MMTESEICRSLPTTSSGGRTPRGWLQKSIVICPNTLIRSEEEIHKHRLIQQKRKEDKQIKRSIHLKQQGLRSLESQHKPKLEPSEMKLGSNVLGPSKTETV